MWSPFYSYLEIRSSAAYAVAKDMVATQRLLDAMPELRRRGLVQYESAPSYPGLELSLVFSRNGNYAISDETWWPEFTLISIVRAKSEDGQIPAQQVRFLVQLAQKLGWELVEDDDDEGRENVVLYQPE